MTLPIPQLIRRALLATVPVLALVGCQDRNAFVPPPPPKVTVAQPLERPVVDTIQFTGNTRATAKVDLRARVTGYLKEIKFEDGQNVQAGDLLFVIEQEPFQAELDAAKAQMEKAKAGLQLAEATLARTRQLIQRNATSRQELDIQAAQRLTSEAEVAAARAAVKTAELKLGYTEVHAPISGRIGRHLVDLGNLVTAEQTLLSTIESIDPIHAYFSLSESDLLRFMGMLRSNELPDPVKHPPVLHLGLANEEGFPHQGTLDFREFGVDPGTGTALRRGVFPNPDGALIPGLFVRIRAPIGSPRPRVLVTEAAVGTDQRGDHLLVVRDDNTVEYRPVTLGIAVGDLRVVEKGVRPGEWVVVNGLQRARPGTKVEPDRGPTPGADTVPAGEATQVSANNAERAGGGAKKSAE